MTEENPVIEPVDDAADAVPAPDPDPTPDPPADPPKESHDEMPSWAESMANRIIDAINTAKEASPITPAQEDVLDKSPVRKPWTHRTPFKKD